jgi:hypothetical protein
MIVKRTSTDRRITAAAILAVVSALAGCGGTNASPAHPVARSSTATIARATPQVPTRTATPAPRPRPASAPRLPPLGALPQTDQLPSSDTPQFHAEMRGLWRAIRTGRLKPGMAAFFPEAAYVQLKAIGSPQSDFQYRLVADYGLDIGAAHALLGSGANGARLVAVNVPAAHWVDPNVCDNTVGYYEVPNTRLVYSVGGQINSLGIASMISWRGVWYVVHLGAILRDTAAGVVDDPSSGPGVSLPSSTC